jgi:hypothetical protein
MTLTRRELLQQTGMGLLALGVSPIALTRHVTTLAVSTPRKLALLVGIDRYGDENHDLQGCITDVQLQRDLLRYRFGFAEVDIVTLTGEQVTREAIETAFREHLIAQAKLGDVVVFHFSGYGSQIGSDPLQTCLILGDGVENAVSRETLLFLDRCLLTDRSTMVFDTSYVYADRPRSGNLRSRSYPVPPESLNPQELTFLEDLRARYQRQSNSGIILNAAKPDQIAVELSGNGWNAGLFTYSLTQYLWEAVPNPRLSFALRRASEKVESLMGTGQEPQILRKGQSSSSFTYHLSSEKSIGGEAIITHVNDDQTLELTLMGLPLEVLENYGNHSCFTFQGSATDEVTVQILARQGLTAKGQLLSSAPPLAVGQVLQEKSRVFPSKIGLIVALDSNLSRIERVDATSAFATVSNVTTVVNVGERRVDCLLSRVGTDESANYHLLSPNGSLILGSLGAENEAVKSGVKRLEPLLETLLALKLWRLLVNEGSSRLAVRVHLETVEKTLLSGQETRQAAIEDCLGADTSLCPRGSIQDPDALLQLPIGTEIRYQIENKEDKPLYGVILGIDSNHQPILVGCSGKSENPVARALTPFVVEPNGTATVPSSSVLNWKVTPPLGLVENYVILSRTPFTETFALLNNIQAIKGESSQFLSLSQPLKVTRALWKDTRVPMALKMDSSGSPLEDYAFDVGTWTTFSFLYQVTPIAR